MDKKSIFFCVAVSCCFSCSFVADSLSFSYFLITFLVRYHGFLFMQTFIRFLHDRGLLENFSSGLDTLSLPVSAYLGFDPTAPSLHIGHWIGICFLRRLAYYGVNPIALVGGATGMIGDPSGKSVERVLLQQEDVAKNSQHIADSLARYLPGIRIVNNAEWFSEMSLIDFLRDVGKHFRLGSMLAKDSVKQRVHSEEGISYTEFSYLLFQAYDFAHLFETYGVRLQCGGSDQWGNITSGIELIRRLGLGQAYGLTYPLLTNSQGKKIGKSESGTLWLDAEMTSPYTLYQYFLRLPDEEMPKIARTLTMLSNEEIFELDKQLVSDPIQVKKTIADAILLSIHGEEGLQEAWAATDNMYGKKAEQMTAAHFEELLSVGLGISMAKATTIGKRWIDLFVEAGIVSSKGEARRLIGQKGLYVNNTPLSSDQDVVEESVLFEGRFVLIAQGKKKKYVLEFN